MSEADNQLEQPENSSEELDNSPMAEVSAPNESSEETLSEASSPLANEDLSSGNTAAASNDTDADLIAQLNSQLEQQNEQYETVKGQYVRLAADFENFRKRTLKEKEEQEVQIKCTTLGELLSVVDNFERAREQLKPQTDAEMTIHKSYQSVYKQMVDALKKLGVSRMRPEGKEFDPNLHEAVLREPSSEHPEGTVIQELLGGYLLGDRVLRHAMVKVAAAMEPTPIDSNPEAEVQTS